MNGMHFVLSRLHDAENDTHSMLLRMAHTHAADQEVHHVSLDLARWSREHVRRLATSAGDVGLRLNPDADAPTRLGERLRSAASSISARQSAPGLLLIDDLRRLYLQTSQASLDWEMLAQLAKAKRNKELLELAAECHPQNLRQIRWANTMLKTLTPQVLSAM